MNLAQMVNDLGRTNTRSNDSRQANYGYSQEREAPAIDIDGLSLLSVDLVVSGTYRQEYLRPYMISTTRDDLNHIADLTDQHGGRVSESGLAGVAGRLMNYSNSVSDQDIIDVENGFDTPRFSFLIDVLEREYDDFKRDYREIVTTISGYTDRLDAATRTRTTRGTTNNQQEILVAPDTRFYITNITRVERETALVKTNDQMIFPSYYRGNNMLGRHTDLYIARPRDVFVVEGVNQRANASGNNAVNINQANKLIGTMPKPSRATNLTPASYLASSINALASAETRSQISTRGDYGSYDNQGSSRENVVRNAAGLLVESNGYESNTFLSMLRNKVGRFTTDNVFTWGDLHNIFGYDALENITDVHNFTMERNRGDNRMSNVDDDIADWNDRENGGRNAVMATILKQAIPAKAFENAILSCSIEATNSLSRTQQLDSYRGINVEVHNVIWSKRCDENEQWRRIKQMEEDIAIGILLDASINNSFEFDISIDLEWRFDSFYRIGIDGGRMMEFTSSGFSGSITTPVLSTSLDLTEHLGRDLRSIVDNVLGR